MTTYLFDPSLRDLMGAADQGKVILWRYKPDQFDRDGIPINDGWKEWHHGTLQLTLNHFVWRGYDIEWQIPEQEEMLIKYKIMVVTSEVGARAMAYHNEAERMLLTRTYARCRINKNGPTHTIRFWKRKEITNDEKRTDPSCRD